VVLSDAIRGWCDTAQKTLDALECFFDLVQAGGIGTTNVPRAAGSKGITWDDGNLSLMQQPGCEVVRGEAGRGD
jgi:hypothetical protein